MAHFARFIVDVIEGLDLRAMSGGYSGSGSALYHPPLATLRTGAAGPGKSGAGRGDGASAEDAGRQEGPCSAQTVPGTGVWHHQISARIPSIFIARARQGARRGEPCDHGLEHQTDVRPQPRLTRPCTAWRRESRRLPVIRGDHNAIWTPPNVRRKLAVAKSPFAFSRNA
jgi:hypothetical protein